MPPKPPFVIHVNEIPDYPEAVYIGRAVPRRGLKRSKWANPFLIGKHRCRADAVEDFECWIGGLYLPEWGNFADVPPRIADIHELAGKPLACWCRRSDEERTNDNTCHGDILVGLWEERFGDEN